VDGSLGTTTRKERLIQRHVWLYASKHQEDAHMLARGDIMWNQPLKLMALM
jgi:hypothetical protein